MFLLIIFISVNMVNATEIHGDVYDINFNKLTNVLVEVNSIPQQSLILKDSGYNFKLNTGNYTIKASYIKNKELIAYVEENVLITDPNGDYNLDLILFPYIENDNAVDINFTGIEDKKKDNKFSILIVILSVISILVVVYLIVDFRKSAKKTEKVEEKFDIIEVKDEALEKAYSIITQEKRINQKDLRKQLNLSEAKVSLIISQLEAEGKVKKIKKGRGNIVLLNK